MGPLSASRRKEVPPLPLMQRLKDLYRRAPARCTLLAVLLALALGLALALARHNGSTYLTGQWDTASQDLVFGRILQMQQGQSAPGGFLGSYSEDWGGSGNRYLFRDNAPADPAAWHSYTHQSGLQGWAWGMLNKAFGLFGGSGEQRETWLYTVNSALFYAATLCVCLAVWRALGLLPAAAWLAAALLAPWVQRCIKDLYWCVWTWLLPLLAVLLFCQWRKKWCLAVIFAAVLLRCMCGFEFISAFLILCELPLVYAWAAALAGGRPARPWFLRMVQAGLAALAGVAAALAVWLAQGYAYYGSWAASLANVTGAVTDRVSLTDGAVRQVTIGQVLYRYLAADREPILQFGPVTVTLPALAAATLAALAVTAAVLALRRDTDGLRALAPAALAWAVSFLGPVSWMVLSKAHADVHTHLMPMLWHVSFVPCSCALWAVLAKRLLHGLRRRRI